MGLRLVDLLTQFETEPHEITEFFLSIGFFLKKKQNFFILVSFFIGFFQKRNKAFLVASFLKREINYVVFLSKRKNLEVLFFLKERSQ